MNVEQHDYKYNQRKKGSSYDPMSTYNQYKEPYLSFQSSTDVIPKKLRGFFNLSKFVPYQLFDGTISLYRFGLYTIHESNEGEYGRKIPHVIWHMSKDTKERNLYDPFSMTVKYIQPHPTASNHATTPTTHTSSSSSSQTELSVTTYGKSMSFLCHTQYTLHALFTRCLSSTSNQNELKLSTGIELDSLKGLSWLFQWRKGDFSINVPIRLSTVLFGTTAAETISFWKVASTSYITFVSCVIDCIIGDVIQQTIHQVITASSSTNNHVNEKSLTLHQKLRKDAEQQKELMKRKAMINKRNEDEKDGLVIVNAMYGLMADIQKYDGKENEIDDDGEKVLDVSVQLQFWVNDSKLVLTSNSKSQMIGFYDVTMGSLSTLMRKEGGNEQGSMGLYSLWKNLLHDDNIERRSSYALPYLMVRYKFNGVLYDIQIRDDEAATLPSPKAVIASLD